MGYRVVKKLWQYVQQFWCSTSVWQTDGQTDRQTDVQPISITCFSIADARKNENIHPVHESFALSCTAKYYALLSSFCNISKAENKTSELPLESRCYLSYSSRDISISGLATAILNLQKISAIYITKFSITIAYYKSCLLYTSPSPRD